MDFVHESFQRIINETPVTSAMFYAFSGLAGALMLIEIGKIYSSMVLKQRIDPWEILRPFAVLLLIGSWKWIYMGLNLGFGGINDALNETLAKQFNGKDGEVLNEMFRQISSDTSNSFLNIGLNSLFSGALNFTLTTLYWLVDVIVWLFVDINDFVLALFAPIALVLSLTRETSSAFLTWLKLFAKFRLFMIGISITNYLTVQLTMDIKSGIAKRLDIPEVMLSIIGVANTITTISLVAFLVCKIIFLLMLWSFLGQILNVDQAGLGAASSQVTRMVKTVATKVATKGVG